jgi:hypothetical protein
VGGGRLAALALTFGATVAATLVNPFGPSIWAGYVGGVATDATARSLVAEWQPPTIDSNPAFFLLTLVFPGAVAFGRRLSATSLALCCGFLWLAWSGQRNILWFGIVAPPIIVEALSGLRASSPTYSLGTRTVLALAATGCLLLGAVRATEPWRSGLGEALGPQAPGALAALAELGPTRVFAEMGYAAVVEWELPDLKVFVDPRVRMFPKTVWADYGRISRGEDAAELLSRYDADSVFLNLADQPGLAQALVAAPEWRRVYADNRSEVWRRGP